MDKYISTDALIEELKRRDFLPVIVKQAIDAVPAADVVPVVRCKDCNHLLRDLSARKYHTCMRFRLPQRVNLDDFCSHGERSNNELDKR